MSVRRKTIEWEDRPGDRFAQTWHVLMKACIVSANEGNRQAAW
jgi:hypothetical protein